MLSQYFNLFLRLLKNIKFIVKTEELKYSYVLTELQASLFIGLGKRKMR
jgi:hypothetical protein